MAAASAAFAVLVAATVGAFFVTTRLKRSPPVIEKLTFTRHFSPNGDGRLDTVKLGFRLRRSDDVTVSIVTRDGDRERTLAEGQELRGGRRYRFRWDGRTNGGTIAHDGEYHLRVGLRRAGRTVTSPRKLFLDTRPPSPVVRYVTPDAISPDGAGGGNQARLRFTGPDTRPTLLVYRTDRGRPRLVARRQGRSGQNEMTWDGLAGLAARRRPAPAGDYLLVVSARDAAGNVGPAPLPPRRGQLTGHPGVVVRYLAARGPLEPVAPGARVRFSVFADGRRYRWQVRRLGSGRPVARGSSRAGRLAVRAPGGRSGVAFLEIRAGRHRYQVPFAVDAGRRRGVLVVLPAATWQARNPYDADGDGFPDVLPAQRRVSLRRPFLGSGLPPGFAAREAPVLLFLERVGLDYDLTTDLALASGGTAPLDRYSGVLFPAAPLYIPRRVPAVLRSYVRVGGRVAWIGVGGMRRTTRVEGSRLGDPSPRREANVFGERIRSAEGGTVAVLSDRIGFFRGIGPEFGPFPLLEEALAPPPSGRTLAAAGREAGRPNLVVYRLPGGVVARMGAGGFGASLASSPADRRIMRRLWTLLSR